MEGITLMVKHEKTPEELFAEQFVKQLQPKTVEDVENGLKSIFGPIFESMLQGELTAHLGYDSNDHQPKKTTNRRNGSKKKILKSSVGEIPINAPGDRDGSFEPILVPKRKTDISGIEQKVLAMYGKGMSQRDIADIIDDIYGFRLSPQQIFIITGSVVEDVAFISMDGLPGLEEGAKAIFPKAVIQRCIVHLVRNSIKYIPSKCYKEFTTNLKLIYQAPNKSWLFSNSRSSRNAGRNIQAPSESGIATGNM